MSTVDWKYYQYHLDLRYNSIILYVIWENHENSNLKRFDGTLTPTMELKNIGSNVTRWYQPLMVNEQWVSCENQLHEVAELMISYW